MWKSKRRADRRDVPRFGGEARCRLAPRNSKSLGCPIVRETLFDHRIAGGAADLIIPIGLGSGSSRGAQPACIPDAIAKVRLGERRPTGYQRQRDRQ